MKPEVGLAFWKLIVERQGWIRHEIRALVDEQIVYRHWALKWGGGWAYEVVPIYIWEQGARPDGPIPYAFDVESARAATAKWKAEL